MDRAGPQLARERRLVRLLTEALAAPPADRAELVARACPDAPELAAEVLDLLADASTLDGFLEQPPVAGVAPGLPVEAAPERDDGGEGGSPQRVGSFRVVRLLGQGGMGQVFLARQTEPVERTVALKLMQPSLASRAARARFQAERQALARLAHRNVARLYESGMTDDGRLFFAMELVDGPPLTRYCDDHELDLEARLRLFLAVCHGVQHAHQKQLVHRDLKPSNIIVFDNDGDPIPKVIDFGIAKALDQPLTEETMLTGGWFPGAPAYTSPEALHGGAADAELDTRSDVYSLGVLLYELLTGVRPFEEDEPGPLEIVRRIREQEPARPSARFAALGADEAAARSAQRRTTPAPLARRLARDLDWIVLRALAKTRDERYESVAALGRDVERYLADEPIEARPPSAAYRLRKLLRRHRLAAALSAAISVVLLLGMAATLLALERARRAESDAVSEARRADHVAQLESQSRREAETVTDFLVELFRGADPWRRGDPNATAAELLQRGAEQVDRALPDEALPRARLLDTIGRSLSDLGLEAKAEPLLLRALALREEQLGAWDLRVAESLDELGALYTKLDRDDEAEPLHRRSLAIAEIHGENGAGRRAQALANIATSLSEQGRYAEAEATYRESLATFDRLAPPRPFARARTLENLAIVAIDQGRAAEAESMLREVLAAKERELDAGSPEIARTLTNLTWALLGQGKNATALPVVTRALEIQEAALGSDDYTVIKARRSLAEVQLELGLLDEARDSCETALRSQVATLGPEHLRVSPTYQCLARVAYRSSDLAAAERHFRHDLAIVERELGPDHPWLADSLLDLGLLLADQGRRTEADASYRRSLAILERSLGASSEAVAEARSRYDAFLARSSR